MAYCRWGESNSDLYVYENYNNIVIHVLTFWELDPLRPQPDPETASKAEMDRWNEDREVHQREVENLPARRPYDGEMLIESLETVIPRLQELFAEGYRAPDYLMELIEARIAEGILDD